MTEAALETETLAPAQGAGPATAPAQTPPSEAPPAGSVVPESRGEGGAPGVGALSWGWALVVGGVALVVRVAVVVAHPLTFGRSSDAADYQRLAVSLATGHGWGVSHYAPGGGPTAFRPPLYPLFLAAVYKVFGVHVTLARLAGATVGALSVMLLIALTARLWDRRVAMAAGILAAVFPPMVMASTALMSEALAIPFELACLGCVVAYRRSRRLGWVLLAGGSLGGAVLTRPNLAVLVVPMVGLVVTRPWRWRALVAGLVVVVAGTLVTVPWLVRDRLAFHHWVPLTTQTGVVVAGTYNQTSARYKVAPGAWIPFPWDPTDAALMARHPHAGEIEMSSVLQSAAWRYEKAHPGYAVMVGYDNTRRLFDLEPLSQTRASTAFSYGVPSWWGDADAVSALAALALAVAGAGLSRKRRIPLAYWSAPVLLWLTTAVLQGMPRLRATLDPFLLQLAAVTLVAASTALRRPRLASTGHSPPISA